MQEIISINKNVTVGSTTIQTINARELHSFLGSAKAFTTWIADRINKYGFVEGVDFTTVLNLPNREVSSGGRRVTDYHISIDMAKELAMVERNDKGREARQYFIECEKRLKEVAPAAMPVTFSEALRLLADKVEQNEKQKVQIEQQTAVIETQKPAVEFVEKYVTLEGLKGFRTVAKLLGAKEQEFRNFLADRKIQYLLQGVWTHHAQYGETGAGYFVSKTGISTRSGTQFTQCYFTPKGVEWITRKWKDRTPMLTRKARPIKLTSEHINA